MATDLPTRQKTVIALLKDHDELLRAMDEDQHELLEEITTSLRENLAEQGVPFYAEEVLAALTALEMILPEDGSPETMVHNADLLRMALIAKISRYWKRRDKEFFTE